MKKIIILSLIILFNIVTVNAGGPIPKGCSLEGYNENEYCPSYYTIGKVKSDIDIFPITEKELLKLDFPLLNIEEGKYYILENNYFYDNGLKNIKESFFVGEGWVNMGKIKKGDVIIIDNNIYGYENNEDKLISIESDKYKKNKINFSGNLKTINTYGNYYKVTCENDIISLSNEDRDYNLGFQHNKIIDKEVSKEIVRNNLQEHIKTCDNFDELFDIKYKNSSYKEKEGYIEIKNKYKKIINKKYWKVLSKINKDKKITIILKIEKLREEKNNNEKLNQEKKDRINIIFDALIEILR
ncbi:MAG: hypothetical protein Q9M94_00500 [Candidatus Gracilibacteria bacterium]|nr:hypothetical protein [Candidatus Gracilibacteria bacterium]